MYTEDLLRQINKNRELAKHGNDRTRCEHCSRFTVPEEHIYTPQRSFFSEQTDQAYYTCEWCGAEVTPRYGSPTKPAQSEPAETNDWKLRRTA